jgi:RNA polymerase sigma-70 factor, ECF subfamily
VKLTADHDFSMSNEELLELCKRQDQEALRLLLRRHERPVYSLLFQMLSNREDAEEALADVFVKVWRAAASFKGDSKFTTWLFKIAANTARDRLRSRMTRREVSIDDVLVNEIESSATGSHETSPEKHAIDAEEMSRIVNAMDGLGEEDRLLVSLYHFKELDYVEIAEITGIPAGNLKVKLFRARQRLRKLCEQPEMDGGPDELRTDTTKSSGLQQGSAEWT